MKKSPRVFRDSFVWMACFSLLATQLAYAATPVTNGPMKKAPIIRDLALQDGWYIVSGKTATGTKVKKFIVSTRK